MKIACASLQTDIVLQFPHVGLAPVWRVTIGHKPGNFLRFPLRIVLASLLRKNGEVRKVGEPFVRCDQNGIRSIRRRPVDLQREKWF